MSEITKPEVRPGLKFKTTLIILRPAVDGEPFVDRHGKNTPIYNPRNDKWWAVPHDLKDGPEVLVLVDLIDEFFE